MKFYSPVIRSLESALGVEDNDKDGKVQVRFLFLGCCSFSIYMETCGVLVTT